MIVQGHSGVPEVTSVIPSPPRSPPLAANTLLDERSPSNAGARRGKVGAAHHITEGSERLFCETLKSTFLVERKAVKEDSLVMGLRNKSSPYSNNVSQWLEIWDYWGDIRFRGFVAGEGCNKSLFVFFESLVVGKDLKPG